MNAIAKREQQEVATELAGIWKQENNEQALLHLAASTRHLPEALSRGHPQLNGRGRASPHVLCRTFGHAPLHPSHQCHCQFGKSRCASAPIRLTLSRPRRVV